MLRRAPLPRSSYLQQHRQQSCDPEARHENKPGISNLLTIYAALKEITIEEAEKEFEGYRYGDFKKAVADVVCAEMESFQKKYREILESKAYEQVLIDGAKKANEIAGVTLKRVKKAVGLLDL